MRSRSSLALCSVGLAAFLVLHAGTATAGKKQPPPPPPVPGGLIYFATGTQQQQLMWVMNPDGSGKTPFPAGMPNEPGTPPNAHPSRERHAGHRWFLSFRKVPGQYYPGGTLQRTAVVAVRDDGALVTELVNQPDLACAPAYSRWSPEDAMVSFVARRYVDGVAGPYQVYVAPLLYDSNGDVSGLAFQPTDPAVAVGSASVIDHDWAPDGTRLVVCVEGSLRVADLTSGTVVSLPTSLTAGQPAWSPDGARIAFTCRPNGASALRTVGPNGTGETTVVSSPSPMANPWWSPDGTYLVYQSGTLNTDVHRVPASGGTPANLTADVTVYANPWGWR